MTNITQIKNQIIIYYDMNLKATQYFYQIEKSIWFLFIVYAGVALLIMAPLLAKLEDEGRGDMLILLYMLQTIIVFVWFFKLAGYLH